MPQGAFGDWLARELRSREWSAADFARRIGSGNSTVTMWLRGERAPTAPSVERIADALLVDFDEVALRAGLRPMMGGELDETSPEAELAPFIRRVKWNADRMEGIKGMMENWIARDEGKRR